MVLLLTTITISIPVAARFCTNEHVIWELESLTIQLAAKLCGAASLSPSLIFFLFWVFSNLLLAEVEKA